MKRALGVLFLLSGLLVLWLLRDHTPVVRLAAASVGMIFLIKIAALLWQLEDGAEVRSLPGLMAFLFFWPGVSFSGFSRRQPAPPPNTGFRFLEAWLTFLLGALALIGFSIVGHGEKLWLNYAGLACILLIVHLGLVEVVADGFRLLGFSPESLFDRPFLSSSLRDFWSFRWNRAFVDMNKIFLLRPLHGLVPGRILVFSIFAVSGLLHELGISYADGLSWGQPTLYFLVQGLGLELERLKKFPRPIVWLWILVPVPLLFTPSFVNLFLGGLSRELGNFFELQASSQGISAALRIGGAAQLLVLLASVQVPGKLGWKTEFQKLRPLNRKVFWTYGCYIFSVILFMSLVSFVLAGESKPNAASFLWLGFISLFWWARVLIDFLYMKDSDWPEGALFRVGHVCLSTLFLSLALLYSAVLGFSLLNY